MGGPSVEPSQDPKASLGSSSYSSKAKEQVLALLDHISIQLGLGSVHKLDFVYLLGKTQKGKFLARPTSINLKLLPF